MAGVGFTVSLFIGAIAFTEEALQEVATVSVLAVSVLAGILGCTWLLAVARRDVSQAAGAADRPVPGPVGRN